MLIRKATKQDARVIAEINVKTWKVAYKGLLSDEILDKRCVTEEKVQYLKDSIGEDKDYVALNYFGYKMSYNELF